MNAALLRILTFVSLWCSGPLLHAGGLDALLPRPLNVRALSGEFSVESDILKIHNEAGSAATIASEYLALRLGRIGIDVEGDKKGNAHLIFSQNTAPRLPAEAYQIRVFNDQIQIRANDQSGFLYAIITLLQLGPDEVWNTDPKPAGFTIPNVIIDDQPALGLRGLMLDVSHHFYPKEFILELLDLLAQHKLNTFHWRLTDDQAWRIEIKAFPKLTRPESGSRTKLPASQEPDKNLAEGFYSQDDVRQVVQRAAELGITIIPEITIPAGCKTAISAYPELLENAELKSSLEFIEIVFAEVAGLFPGAFIHSGGYKRSSGISEKSPAFQAMMKREGLQSTTELQNYFFRRIDTILKKYDKRLLTWQEIAYETEINHTDSAIMSWNDHKQAMHEIVTQGTDLILSPASQAYFNAKYEPRSDEPGQSGADTINTKDAYAYRPLKIRLANQKQPRILGSIACLWSESVISLEQADYLLWPRLCAFAEVTWSDHKKLQWHDFNNRLHNQHLPRLERQEVAYRVPQPNAKLVEGELSITPPYPKAEIHFTLDGTIPTVDSPIYADPIALSDADRPRFATFTPNSRHSRIMSGPDSYGQINIQLAPRKVAASQDASDPDHLAAKGSDGNMDTAYRSKDKARIGDTFTVTFDQPQTGSKLTLSTGSKDGHERANSGILEFSEDGINWKYIGRPRHGHAELKLETPTLIKSIRFRIDQALDTPLVVREFQLQ